MQLRKTSAREERNFANFESEKARAHANEVMSKVVRNPLILDAIFAKLDLPDLKKSRLVCHDWNDVASTLLGKRAYLRVNPLISYKPSQFDEVPPVPDKLMRRILISDKYHWSIRSNKKKTQVITKALTELPKVSELTREIKFVAARKEFVPAFCEGMTALGSTKVQRVEFLSAWKRDKVYRFPAEAYQKLPPQPYLTSLRLRLISDFGNSRIQTEFHEFQHLIQIWLEAAPNLTTLDVTASLYPNLEGCKSLKVLKFEYPTRPLSCPQHLCLHNLTDMLGQVKDSLIELELDVESSGRQIHPVLGGPVMSRVTTLSIHVTSASSNASSRILDFFDEDHFPKLKILRVRQTCGDSMLPNLNTWRRHVGVQSLALSMDFSGEEFERKLVNLFPAVKKFELNVKHMHRTSISALNRSIEPFKTWDLERVSVVVEGVRQSSVLLKILKVMSILKGVKSVRFPETYVKEDHFSRYIQDLILQSGGFNDVEISGLVVSEIVERIRPIFDANGGLIHFTGGVYSSRERIPRRIVADGKTLQNHQGS
ncbi:uncharacterized protein LOC118437520 [Folsomia candida]|uniref:uncharacterized protein LOC118437520 n=1 Tax=Folsomia candida TaxID=158441 RepID=UPI001604F2EC|nr:uncharacterized protein LOC118437520 [Folsomia candida]XP_035712465.1 uncharacterized protein LOC118437520 [Folsomia candida]